MKKMILTLIVISTFLISFHSPSVLAKDTSSTIDNTIPEKNGTYDIPGKTDLKVRVFVHEPSQQLVNSSSCDGNSDAEDGLAGWKLPSTWIYTLNTKSLPSSITPSDIKQVTTNAFSRWQTAVNNTVTFNEDTNTTTVVKRSLDGKNIIAWGKTSGTALAVTYIWYNTQTKQVVETDTIFNNHLLWTWSDPTLNQCSANTSSFDVQDILTHETGHWMGLDDEYTSNFVDNTMYGYGAKGEIKKGTLASGDVTAVTNLYK